MIQVTDKYGLHVDERNYTLMKLSNPKPKVDEDGNEVIAEAKWTTENNYYSFTTEGLIRGIKEIIKRESLENQKETVITLKEHIDFLHKMNKEIESAIKQHVK